MQRKTSFPYAEFNKKNEKKNPKSTDDNDNSDKTVKKLALKATPAHNRIQTIFRLRFFLILFFLSSY